MYSKEEFQIEFPRDKGTFHIYIQHTYYILQYDEVGENSGKT